MYGEGELQYKSFKRSVEWVEHRDNDHLGRILKDLLLVIED